MEKLRLAMLIKTSLGIFSLSFLIIDISIFRKLRNLSWPAIIILVEDKFFEIGVFDWN